jgi:hypothetical protein
MIKYNGHELHGTAPDADIPYLTKAECEEINRKADRFFERRGIGSNNWRASSSRGITHRTAKRRPSCGG